MAGIIGKISDLFRRFVKADIVRVFSLTSISTLVKMCTGLISVKVVASIIGPAGVALVGQLNNFAGIMMSFAGGGINSGITKYVAEYRDDDSCISRLLSNALRITAICSLVCALFLIVLHRQLSELVMLSPDYGYVFVIFGFTVLLYGLNNMLTSIVNGYKEFREFVYISIANSIVGVVFTVTLVMVWQLEGALISAVTYQSAMLFITLYMLRHEPWLRWSNFRGGLSRVIASRYFGFSLMALATVLTAPVVQMILRGYVMKEISPVEAGWWEGMNRISNMYLMVITSSFSVYYLPRLSEITDRPELRREIFRAYKVVIPLLLMGFVLIYLLRFFIIRILFTPDFMPMSQLFAWQMAGDFFKICSWLLAFLMIARAMPRAYIVTEVMSAVLWLLFGLLFVGLNGVVGLCQAYIATYVIYLISMVVIFREIVFFRKK